MEITEVRVALREGTTEGNPGERRLKAYATLTFDHCFVVRNIKIIDGRNGLFVAMPSRRPKATCPKCGFKADAGGRYCARCGAAQPSAPPAASSKESESQAHRDIAHPITAAFRQELQEKVLEAYEAEKIRAGEERPAVSNHSME